MVPYSGQEVLLQDTNHVLDDPFDYAESDSSTLAHGFHGEKGHHDPVGNAIRYALAAVPHHKSCKTPVALT